jgi:hypothetical protein
MEQTAVSNLLYFQTNYLVVAAMMISVVVFLIPKPLQYDPWRNCGGVVFTGYFLISMFEGVMSSAFDITFPWFLMFIHASLRIQNLKNKLENKMEGIGLKKTPMGIVLDALEQQKENISKFTDCISKVKD